MIKLGEFDEDEARDVAKYLRDAGMKVEIRTFTDGWPEDYHYLEGRLSELKGKIDDDEFKDHERYLAALKAVHVKGATLETFEKMLRSSLTQKLMKRDSLFEILLGVNSLPIQILLKKNR